MAKLTSKEVTNHQIAERLDTLTSGLARVYYSHEVLLAGHPSERAGHRFYCHLESEATEFWLDDRAFEPLNVQLAHHLRELADRLDEVADRLASRPMTL